VFVSLLVCVLVFLLFLVLHVIILNCNSIGVGNIGHGGQTVVVQSEVHCENELASILKTKRNDHVNKEGDR
jgi:hypothetical protein